VRVADVASFGGCSDAPAIGWKVVTNCRSVAAIEVEGLRAVS
jgi:hypothetical protein